MDVVDDLVVFADVGYDVHIEASFVGVHIGTDVLHGECDWLLNLLIVLNFLDLVVRELILGSAEEALISKQFLPFFLSNDLFR